MPQTSTELRFFSSISDDTDTERAISTCLEAVEANLGGQVDLLVAFYTGHHLDNIDSLHERLQRQLNPTALLGVSAEGVIGMEREIEGRPGLSILAASLPGAELAPFHISRDEWTDLLADEDAIRARVLGEGMTQADLRCLLLFPEPFSSPLLKALPAIDEAFAGVPIVGGVASAAREPNGNRLMIGDQLVHGGAIGLAVGGDIHVVTTVSQGCRPIGKPFVVTKSKRHIVHELGGHKALDAIEQTVTGLTETDRELCQSNGLLLGRVINEYKDRFGRGDFLIRSIIGADRGSGFIAIGDPQLRVGQTLQLHVRDQATAQEDFRLLLEAQKIHGQASGSLLFSCNGRGTRLFDHPHADAAMVHEALGDVPLAGFFAAGEIGPVADHAFLHGHTASFVAFRPGTPNAPDSPDSPDSPDTPDMPST